MTHDKTTKPRAPRKAKVRVEAESTQIIQQAAETASLDSIQKLLRQTQEQIAVLYGVIEELCERQEMMAQWQSEFGKRMLDLQESQSWTLQDVAESSFQAALTERQKIEQKKRLKQSKRDVRREVHEMDQLIDEFEDGSEDLSERSRKRRDANANPMRAEMAELNPMIDVEVRDAQEPVLVMPVKTELH